MDTSRDLTLDIMRGLAVFLMVQGNMAGAIFEHPYPIWMATYVFLGSFVPALFILVAGMVVAYTVINKGYTLKHFMLRGAGLIFGAAIFLDVFIWGHVPFTNMDVLYLIGLSLPLTYFFLKLSTVWRWAIILFIFIATPVLQYFFGYVQDPLIIDILTGYAYGSEGSSILQHWFIDGWFPIFPWLGFAFLGANLGVLRWKERVLETFASKQVVLTAIGLLAFGALLWMTQSQEVFIRQGFSEAIYPPTLAYVFTALGEILLLFALVNWRTKLNVYKPLIAFGQSALFVYIAHFALMEWVWNVESLQSIFLTKMIFSLVLLFAASYVLLHVRKRYPKRPLVLRLLGI